MTGLWLATAVFSCLVRCSSAGTRPPEFGSCVPTADASCPLPQEAVGAGAAPPPESGMPGESVPEASIVASADACAAANGLTLVPNGLSCQPCAVASCCTPYGACQDDPTCAQLLVCAAEGTAAFDTCLAGSPTVNPAYQSLAGCLALYCPTVCAAIAVVPMNDL